MVWTVEEQAAPPLPPSVVSEPPSGYNGSLPIPSTEPSRATWEVKGILKGEPGGPLTRQEEERITEKVTAFVTDGLEPPVDLTLLFDNSLI